MSSYSFQGRTRVWTPRDEEENRAIFSAQKQETGIRMPNEFKPVYLANAEYEVEKWSVQQLMRLLRLYGAHSCLWNIHDPDNRNRKLRKAALIDITAAMGNGVTRAQVVQKINVLRATYRYEKRRIKQRIRKGIGARTKLKWFALADAFLRKVPRMEKSRRNKCDVDDSDLEDTVVFNVDPETILPIDDDEDDSNYIENPVKVELIEDVGIWNDSSVVVKSELTYHNLPLSDASKRCWTSQDSVHFVHLLKTHSILWNSKLHSTKEQVNARNAIESISELMQMPVQRIRKRIDIFKHTYKSERLKIIQNPKYKPPFPWWPVAESFMERAMEIDTGAADNFVDANLVAPATPANVNVKMEISESNDEMESLEVPLNPISSVPPPSVASVNVEEALDQLFNESSNSFNLNNFKLEPSTNSNENSTALDAVPSMKLIWNGLEDDLLEGKWSLKHSVKFFRLYGAHRCLWDLNDPDCRSREMRNAAIEDIAAAMGYGLTADYVAKKIKIFRITYMQQRKRMLDALKRGEEPEIQLRWFPLADSFLRPHIGLRCIKDNEREMPQFDYQYVVANLNLIDPALLTDFRGKGTQNTIAIGADNIRDIEDD